MIIMVATLLPASAAQDDWKTYVSKYMSEVVKLAASAPEVIAAVQEQNAANAESRRTRSRLSTGSGGRSARSMAAP